MLPRDAKSATPPTDPQLDPSLLQGSEVPTNSICASNTAPGDPSSRRSELGSPGPLRDDVAMSTSLLPGTHKQ